MQASLGCMELTCMLWTPRREAPGLPWHLHPLWLSLLSLIKFWLSMRINLQIAALFFAFLFVGFFSVSFIIMHIFYAHTLGIAGFEEEKLAKNNHLGWRTSTI